MAKATQFQWASISVLAGLFTFVAGIPWLPVIVAAVAVAFVLVWIWNIPRKAAVLVPFFVLVGVVYAGAHAAVTASPLSLPRDSEEFQVALRGDRSPTQQGVMMHAELVAPHSGTVRMWFPSRTAPPAGAKVTVVAERARESAEPLFFAKEVVRVEPTRSLAYYLGKLKARFLSPFQQLPKAEGALAAGITFGERGWFSERFRDAMKGSGTTHLVALSGYNVAILVSAVFALLLGLGLAPRRVVVGATVLVVSAFVVMVGGEASIVRAAIMGLVALLAREVGRVYSFSYGATYAAFGMALWNPNVLVDVGFQLSFLALLGLVYVLPRLDSLLSRLTSKAYWGLREHFATTVSAQAAVFPLLLFYFGVVSPFSLIANTLILPAMPITMAFSFLYSALANLWWPLGFVAGKLVTVLLSYEVGVIELFGTLI